MNKKDITTDKKKKASVSDSSNKKKITMSDGYKTYLHKWEAKNEKAIVQLVHGSIENIERYDEFAKFLRDNGISVWGIDLRGHGYAARENGTLSTFFDDKVKGAEKPRIRVLKDLKEITEKIKKEKGDLPRFIIGHSMGSMITRAYANKYTKDYDKVIAIGTAHKSFVVRTLVMILSGILKTFGPKKPAKTIFNLSYNAYNKEIKDNKTNFDWLSFNEQNVQNYINDPFCGWMFDNRSIYEMFKWLSSISKKRYIKRHEANVPILLIAGRLDPVSEHAKEVIAANKQYKKLGKDVTMILHDDMRHEILQEDNRKEVFEEILKFLLKK